MKINLRSKIAGLNSARRRLARDKSGLAMLEFAFSMPIVLMIGLYGIETANLALINLKVSQIALGLADNAARVGTIDSNQVEQLREVDMNDVLDAARTQGKGIKLTTYGRITVSSLEADSAGAQRIHWQRCVGMKNGAGYDSSYGLATTGLSNAGAYDPNAGVNTATLPLDNSAAHPGALAVGAAGGPVLVGMGDSSADAVKAPTNGGVMFVEVNYLYQPVVGNWLYGAMRIHYIASFVVRDNRDFAQVYNPLPIATKATCNTYAA
ncbi:Flp pilus assembly protein TadG [Sphingomonas sp. UYAg733]